MAIGLIYLIAFSIGGQPGNGLIGLGIMVAFSAVLVLPGGAARRSGASSTTVMSGWPGSTCEPRP